MTCPHCGKTCADRVGLGVHLRKSHGVLGTNAVSEARSAPLPDTRAVLLPVPYGPALEPDYSFRDALLSALEQETTWKQV